MPHPSCTGFSTFEDHAGVVQARDEGRLVDLPGAAGTMAEPDDIGARLLQTGCERKPFGMEGEWYEAFLPVGVVAHENRLFPVRFQGVGTIAANHKILIRIASLKHLSCILRCSCHIYVNRA